MNQSNVAHKLCVAPMMERTDRHCRYLLRLAAPHARLYTEMITAHALLRGDHRRFLEYHPSEHPVALQLGGSDAASLAQAAALGAAAGYDEINLNVGCPSGRVQAGCFGAALMLEADLVAEAVASLRAAVAVPVTVKTRIGVDEHDSFEFLSDFTRKIVAAGCETLIVHARKAWLSGLSPKQNRDIPPLDYARVYRLKAQFPSLPIVINGGLTSIDESLAHLTQVDGIMLGRAAYKDPMLMAALDARLFPAAPPPSAEEVIDAYLEYVEAELDRGTPLRRMTRHLMGMCNARRGSKRWRHEVSRLEEGSRGLHRLRALVHARREDMLRRVEGSSHLGRVSGTASGYNGAAETPTR